MRFKKHLEDPVTLILYATFPETMEIDQTRNVKLAIKDKLQKKLYNALTLNACTNKYFDEIYSKDINKKT